MFGGWGILNAIKIFFFFFIFCESFCLEKLFGSNSPSHGIFVSIAYKTVFFCFLRCGRARSTDLHL